MKLEKRLSLNKETLQLLSAPQAGQVDGGVAMAPVSRWQCTSLNNCVESKYPICQIA